MLRPILLTAVLVGAGGASALEAQRIEVQALGGRVSDESGGVGRGLTIAPAIAWDGTRGWLRLEGRGTALEGGGRVMGTGAGFYLGLGRTGFLELGAAGSAGLLTSGSGFRSVTGELSPGLRLDVGVGSVGAGVGVRAASLSSTPAAWRQAIPFAGAPERTAVARSLWTEARTHAGALSLGAMVRASRTDGRAWQEASGGAAVQIGPLALSGFVGTRAGEAAGSWAGGAASLRVATGVDLLAQLAHLASDPLTGQPGGRTAAVGVSLSRGSASASPRAVRTVRLALRASPGARVELLGDWNDWRPEPLTDQGGGVFAREVRLAPGVYHFVFRVNGELRVPEGFETAPDDFGGRSAVVRVRA
jgi:hypothetical protein